MSVFISYSRADSDFVDLLQRLLISKGYDAWLDRRNIDAGSRWDNVIEQAIQSRTHTVVVLSPEASESQNVSDEWNYAFEEGKTVIPLYYRECSIPMRLRRLQWIDFEKTSFADAFSQLTLALGDADHRPTDPIELAKREGIILVEVRYPLDIEKTRVGYVYSDYPMLESFLSIVFMTLLRDRVKSHSYGDGWILRDKLTKQEYHIAGVEKPEKLLLHEIGLEPGSQLEIVFSKGIMDDFYNDLKRT